MIKENSTTLRELIELATPFDESSHSKEVFLQKITPELEEEFSEKYTEEFKKMIQKKGLYFIVNISKIKTIAEKTTIKLSTCGPENVPTISLNC